MKTNYAARPIECSICHATAENCIEAGKLGWDWFTGYLDERFAACPKCLNDALTVNMRKLSKAKPETKLLSRTIILPTSFSSSSE